MNSLETHEKYEDLILLWSKTMLRVILPTCANMAFEVDEQVFRRLIECQSNEDG